MPALPTLPTRLLSEAPNHDAAVRPRAYTVAVRTLCDFTARQGDLDLRFTPAPTAQQGIAGHVEVASRRPAGYEREVELAGEHRHLRVRGRADGYDPLRNRLEEIKTHRGDVGKVPDNHRHRHWAQARVYAWLLCEARGLPGMEVALVYFDIARQTETVLTEQHDAARLKAHFEMLCERFLVWADQEAAHRDARDAALTALAFPHGEFRAGQRTLAEAVYKANVAGRCLLAQAPTGIGKTVGTLFPALKAMPPQRLDKLFYLTAKTPGRQLALDALERIQASASPRPLRALELVARDKACEHPDKACHGDSCPLAQGFYDRLPHARQAAINLPAMDKHGLRDVALAHAVCRYYLAQEMVRWSDVVVGDYNHFFDLSALLHALTVGEEWRVSVLADEAHNLVDRSRQMYTATLDPHTFSGARHSAPAALKKPLDTVQRQWTALTRDQAKPYAAHDDVPEKFLLALQKATTAVTDHFAEHPASVDIGLQRWYFDALQFQRVAELHGAHAMFDITLGEADGRRARHAVLCLRNVVPAPLLKDRWRAAHSVTLFSATLSPTPYYLDMLGLPDNTACMDVPTPFASGQLAVRVASHISTRYADRTRSLARVVEAMAAQYTQAPGNYLAFFSSFDYLQMAAERFTAEQPDVPVWLQSRRMDEAERAAFVGRFAADGSGIGFAVLGGAFGEGIDLPGSRLIGAFIATLGLPQVNPVNEQFRARLEASHGLGYDYTYLVPGLQKVVQAAGRVIRTLDDRGTVLLMDDRFARPEVRALLPAWWQIHSLRPASMPAAVTESGDACASARIDATTR